MHQVALICRWCTYHAACTIELLVPCITLVNEETASFIRPYERLSIDQLETSNHHMVCDVVLYTQAFSRVKDIFCVTQQHDTCSKHDIMQAVKETL